MARGDTVFFEIFMKDPDFFDYSMNLVGSVKAKNTIKMAQNMVHDFTKITGIKVIGKITKNVIK